MSSKDIELLIEDAERLKSFCGGAWPCFHDAEVVELHLWRGHLYPGDWDDRNVFPILTMSILVLGATQSGATDPDRDILVTLRFYGVDEVRLRDFNHNNSIVDFLVTKKPRGNFISGEPLPPHLLVTLNPGFGVAASFLCYRIEIVNAEVAASDPVGAPRP
jgi:hypothetical protein